MKKLRFILDANGFLSETAETIKKVILPSILLSITLTFDDVKRHESYN